MSSVVGAAGASIVAGAAYLGAAFGWRQGALLLVGASAGVVLYHAAFGFTTSWRMLITTGRGAAVRAQMLMLAVTCAVFVPLIARGEVFGQAVRGSAAPVGLSVVAGAFLFGIGMQRRRVRVRRCTRWRGQHADVRHARGLHCRVRAWRVALRVLGRRAGL
jgi:uncharacterized membrane protein YedE/YeeE